VRVGNADRCCFLMVASVAESVIAKSVDKNGYQQTSC
jgi:hypothetical protein